jgi:hypothetical protein
VIASAKQTLKGALVAVAFSERTFTVICRALGPTLSGRLCALFIARHEGTLPACLCIDRDVFRKDIAQLRVRTDRSWPSITQQLVYLFEQAWVPHFFFKQTAFQAELPRVPPKAMRQAERFAASFLRSARRRHGIAAMLSGSVDYAPDEFLRRAGQREGIPFLALCKEHAVTDYGHRSFAASLTGFRFEGDGVAVFGPRSVDILADEGVFPPEQVWVTGMPRLDEWVDAEVSERRDVALLFTFANDWQHGSAAFPEVLRTFAAAAEAARGEGLRFVVKCRDPYEEILVRDMVARVDAPLEVTSHTPVPELLRRAFVAIGFCSLALTEALLSPAVVASIRFGACSNDVDAQFDEHDERLADVVRFPHSAPELSEIIRAAMHTELSPADVAARRAIIEEMFCAPARTYSARVDAFVDAGIAGTVSQGEPAVPVSG